MTPVTDPELLKKLEGGDTGPKPVTDSAILEQLEGKKKPATAAQPESGMWKSAADFFKYVGGKAVKGLTDFGELEKAGSQQMRGINPEELAPQQRPGAGGEAIQKALPQPSAGYQPSAATRAVGAGVEAATNPASYIGAAGPVRGAVSALGAGAGSEVGRDIGGTPGALVGGALGGLAGGTRINPEIPAASRATIRDAAEAAYDSIKDSPRKIPLEESSALAEKLRDKLNSEGIYREAPEGISVFKTLDRLNSGVNADHITPGEVHSVTKTLQKIASSNPGNATGQAAQLARSELFEHLKQYPELAEAIETGNANWRALKTSEKIETAKEKGELGARSTMTGDNIDSALRTQIRQMYFNNKVYKTPEEKAVMKAIVEGDTASNIAKTFRTLKTPIRHAATAIMHAKSAGILNHGAEWLLKGVAKRNTERQISALDEAVRWGAPASGSRPVPGPQTSRGAQRAGQAARGAIVGEAASKREKNKANVYEE